MERIFVAKFYLSLLRALRPTKSLRLPVNIVRR
jgi:hypothetical protein